MLSWVHYLVPYRTARHVWRSALVHVNWCSDVQATLAHSSNTSSQVYVNNIPIPVFIYKDTAFICVRRNVINKITFAPLLTKWHFLSRSLSQQRKNEEADTLAALKTLNEKFLESREWARQIIALYVAFWILFSRNFSLCRLLSLISENSRLLRTLHSLFPSVWPTHTMSGTT